MRQPSPADLLSYGWDLWRTALAAQTTVALRLWSLALPHERESAWGQAELWRMVGEKQAAFLEAGLATQRALLRANPALMPVLQAGLRPYQKRTTANARRLGRRL
jgi:hypothetical protein